MKKLILVCGARPNFMKIAPLVKAISRLNKKSRKFSHVLVHTGQHYDYMMSKIFFQELHIPKPHIYLGVGSASHAEQTGKIMIAFDRVLQKEKCDGVVVVGDVNSTIACALASAKRNIPVAHVEAGLRSFDRTMPEEINRLLTDAISDFLFTPSADANRNLRREGVPQRKIFFVGDIMIDSLLSHKNQAEKRALLKQLGLIDNKRKVKPFVLVTLHRPSNVDQKLTLTKIALMLQKLSQKIPVLFPMHPRTRNSIRKFSLEKYFLWHDAEKAVCGNALYAMNPLGYLDFLHLMLKCSLVLTDSGGIQEETSYLGIPCITLRTTTERPVTLTHGTNVLVGNDMDAALYHAERCLGGFYRKPKPLKFWDGKTAYRILNVLQNA